MANKQSGGTRLTGINPLSYMGVEPVSPPQLVRYQVQPTNRDFNYNLGDLWLVESPFQVWMLLDKPQNVAFWALIYPQGGSGGISLIHTDAGDVVPDVNGEIGIIGGENINVGVSGPNQVVINLNRTIQWPDTNAAGTEGVIYLNGDRFLHNVGDSGGGVFNTFLGTLAGNFTLGATADANTGIGGRALTNVTDGRRNTAVGTEALRDVTTGENNIALGRIAGDRVVAGFDNIHIGNRGAVADGDSSTIRIGTEGVQLEAHMAGIFGSTVQNTVTPNTVLNVDDDGQIGQLELTSSGATIAITQPSNGVINLEAIGGGGGGGNPFAFSYVQVADTPQILPGTVYDMGTQVALTKLFDVGNNFFPGDGAGAGAVFTAPVTGKYYFEFYVVHTGQSPANGVPPSRISIITSKRTYTHRIPNSTSQEGTKLNEIYTVVTDLDLGETATFEILINQSIPVLGYIINGNSSPTTTGENSTRISGFLIPEGASGGNFSQPFLGIQQVDTNVPVVGGIIGPYELGSGGNAPIVEQFDVGNNFDGGDGAGTPATFTAPETGIYTFNVGFYSGSTNSGSIAIGIFVNGVQAGSGAGTTGSDANIPLAREFILSLTMADVVTFKVNIRNSINPAATNTVLVSRPDLASLQMNNLTFISGYRIA